MITVWACRTRRRQVASRVRDHETLEWTDRTATAQIYGQKTQCIMLKTLKVTVAAILLEMHMTRPGLSMLAPFERFMRCFVLGAPLQA